MQTSDSINELAAALAKAQAESALAMKDATNPHFRSTYATLQSVREAILPFHQHGLSVVQGCRTVALDAGLSVEVETRLVHVSGQWMADTLTIPVSKADAQGVASATTYARRIGAAGLCGIAPADDDGEAAVGRAHAAPRLTPKPEGLDDWLTDMAAVADTGLGALETAWKKSPAEYRDYIRGAQPRTLDALKATAKAAGA